jgi:hypothetical protein
MKIVPTAIALLGKGTLLGRSLPSVAMPAFMEVYQAARIEN